MKILFKTIFGSHLYGTDTPNSDTDYKGIFKESLENIILKDDRETFHENTNSNGEGQKNSPHDIDVEFKELRRFLRDCLVGQTYALDLLFSTPDKWIIVSDEWKFIIAHREKLLSKNVQPYIEYCRQQAGKYGLKGSRLGELLRVIEFLKKFKSTMKLIDVLSEFQESEFAKVIQITSERKNSEKPITETFLEVLGKKFEQQKMIKEILPALEKMNEMYGGRARLALENKGVDWKAVSHAFRCCYQLQELAKTKKITFPLLQAEKLKKIKIGAIPYCELQEELVTLMNDSIAAINSSNLPEEPDKDFWDKYLVRIYSAPE